MNKQQLEVSIAKMTEAIKLISETEGFYYDKACAVTSTISEQRRRMQKELKDMEIAERKAASEAAKAPKEKGPFDIIMYDQPKIGYTAMDNKANVIGEQKVNYEGKVLEQYIYTIEGHAGNFISLKANIII